MINTRAVFPSNDKRGLNGLCRSKSRTWCAQRFCCSSNPACSSSFCEGKPCTPPSSVRKRVRKGVFGSRSQHVVSVPREPTFLNLHSCYACKVTLCTIPELGRAHTLQHPSLVLNFVRVSFNILSEVSRPRYNRSFEPNF
jgi:hypothetical protein